MVFVNPHLSKLRRPTSVGRVLVNPRGDWSREGRQAMIQDPSWVWELWEHQHTMPSRFNTECFFIAPIGHDNSEIRKRSDGVRDWIVEPAAEAAANLNTVRADEVGEPGQITAQAIQHCLEARAAVADLTGGNANVYYELSVRHGALKPVVLIAEVGTTLPFDISQSRVIFFDHKDLRSAGQAKEELQVQIEASLLGTPSNPISDGMRLAQLQSGNVEERVLASIMERMGRLATAVEGLSSQLGENDENFKKPRFADQRNRVAQGLRASSFGPTNLQARVEQEQVEHPDA